MDRETRDRLEFLAVQLEGFGVRVRRLEEADPTPWLKGLDRRVGALESAGGLAQRPDGEEKKPFEVPEGAAEKGEPGPGHLARAGGKDDGGFPF